MVLRIGDLHASLVLVNANDVRGDQGRFHAEEPHLDADVLEPVALVDEEVVDLADLLAVGVVDLVIGEAFLDRRTVRIAKNVGLGDIDDIKRVVEEVGSPLNVLLLPNGPTVGELAEVGVRRVSTGGSLAFAAYGALAAGARAMRIGFVRGAVTGGGDA